MSWKRRYHCGKSGPPATAQNIAVSAVAKSFPAIEDALSTAGTTAAEAVGWAKLGVDGLVFFGSTVACRVGH